MPHLFVEDWLSFCESCCGFSGDIYLARVSKHILSFNLWFIMEGCIYSYLLLCLPNKSIVFSLNQPSKQLFSQKVSWAEHKYMNILKINTLVTAPIS